MIQMRLKTYLKQNGIKQIWLAEQIGMPPNKLSGILSGKSPLYADVLARICNVLNVSSELFCVVAQKGETNDNQIR